MKKISLIRRKITAVLTAFVASLTVFVSVHSTDFVMTFAGVAPDVMQQNSTTWYAVDGADATALPFQFTDGDGGTALSARIIANDTLPVFEKMPDGPFIVLNLNLTVTSIPSDARFAFVYGLQDVESAPNENGNAMLYFSVSEEQIYCGFSMYGEESEEILVAEAKGLGVFSGDEVSLRFTVGKEGDVKLEKLNGGAYEEVFSAPDAEAVREGYVGFLQTGSRTTVSVNDFSVDYFANVRPNNYNAIETFSYNNFDTNIWTSYAANPGGLPMRQVVASDAFLFENTRAAYFGTRHAFSNVVFEADIPYIQRTPVYDGSELVKTVSDSIIIAVCAPNQSTSTSEAKFAVEFAPADGGPETVARETLLKMFYQGVEIERIVLPQKYNMWSIEHEEKVFGVRIRYVDGEFSVFLKDDSENGFTKMTEHDFGMSADTGYVSVTHGWSSVPDWRANFSIDNVSVRSLDADSRAERQILTAPGRVPHKPDDYPYENTWDPDDLPFGGNT